LPSEAPELPVRERRLASCETPADALSQAADAVFRAVWSALPQGLPLFVDAGELRRAACTLPVVDDPRHLILCEREAPMGFALSAALGAACARPGQAVVALMGDGSFLMHATELSTAAQARVPLVGVVHCNGVLAAPYQRAGHGPLAEQLRTPAFEGPALCQSLGVAGRTVSIAELPAALMQALAQAPQRPQLLFVS
jgi:acetolactate synthase-1/2/3 large subunit